MFGRCPRFSLPVILTSTLALVSTTAVAQNNFTPACTTPSTPGTATAIDSRCSLQGAGGKEAAQNEVKNNFCATETPSPTNFPEFSVLQDDVEKDTSINFGPKGPTTDRAPLTALGEGKPVQLKAFVLTAKQEGPESVNCGHDFDGETNKDLFHDIHISIVPTKQLATPATPAQEPLNECQGIVVEMSPHFRPPEWTAANVNRVATAHLLVQVTGQRFFDSSHVPCANGHPVGSNPKRMSLWEIHPIYKFEVCTANCGAAGTWVSLEEWVKANPNTGPSAGHAPAGHAPGPHKPKKPKAANPPNPPN